MYVSGLTLQSKKKIIDSQKTKPIRQIQRPSSNQFPDIYEPRAVTTTKFISKNPQRETSQHKPILNNKIKRTSEDPTRHYVSQSRTPLQKKQSKDNREIREIKNVKQVSRKSKKLQINRSQTEQCQFQNQQRLLAFYRYSPMSTIGICGSKEELMKVLSEKGEFGVAGGKVKKRKGLQPIWQKMIKLALLKGKYKYRQKFNFSYSPQLKSLNYKRKQQKKRKQSSSSSSDDEPEKKQRCRDLQSWKKSNGVQGSKVFIVKGKYRDLRNALLQRGWVQNQDRLSQFYDLKWTTKVSDVNFQSLRAHQIVNHFNNNACLTSKYGIIKSLRSIMYSENIDIDKFFAKAFDMTDLHDFQNFLEVYKWTYAVSVIKQASKSKQAPQDLQRISMALVITLRRLLPAEKLLSTITNARYPLCSPAQWRFLYNKRQGELSKQSLGDWDLSSIQWPALSIRVKNVLQQLERKDPQYVIDGPGNVWIAKPAFLSRGRGIKCISDFEDLLDFSIGKQTQYVIQKYIQNPLIINRRKFDIRQWVIVEEYCPPRVWFYAQFYLRFCLQDYDVSKLGNKFAHLTNNSVQKHNSKVSNQKLMNQSMWTMQQMEKFIEQTYGQGNFKTIISKMRQIVVATILGTQDQVYGRKGSFQLIGYDFMIDDRLNPWLIQVNSSPSMDYSTPVTCRLVKMVLEDTVKVMVDQRKKKTKKRGLFKLIYDGESAYEFKHYKMGTNN